MTLRSRVLFPARPLHFTKSQKAPVSYWRLPKGLLIKKKIDFFLNSIGKITTNSIFSTNSNALSTTSQMDSLSAIITSSLTNGILSSVKGCVEEFISVITKEINSKEGKKKEWNEEIFTSMWNKVAKEFVITKKGKKVNPENQCIHLATKGEIGKRCEGKISDKSTTHQFCSKHYKTGENKKKSSKKKEGEVGECCFIITRGLRDGEECGANVSSKSKSGHYCSKHISEEKKEKKVNKPELMKFIRDQLKKLEEDDDTTEVFNEVEKKYGYMTLYNLKKISKKIYEEHKDNIDILIENGREDHENEITEEEEDEKKEKQKKSKYVKASSDKKKKEEKPVKSGGKSSTKKKDDEEEKPVKSGSKKSSTKKKEEDEEEEEVIEEEEEKPVKSSGKKTSTKKKEEEEEVIEVKKIREGALKGKSYFDDKKSGIRFLLNKKTMTVTGKVSDEEEVDLVDEEKEIINEKYTDFSC